MFARPYSLDRFVPPGVTSQLDWADLPGVGVEHTVTHDRYEQAIVFGPTLSGVLAAAARYFTERDAWFGGPDYTVLRYTLTGGPPPFGVTASRAIVPRDPVALYIHLVAADPAAVIPERANPTEEFPRWQRLPVPSSEEASPWANATT